MRARSTPMLSGNNKATPLNGRSKLRRFATKMMASTALIAVASFGMTALPSAQAQELREEGGALIAPTRPDTNPQHQFFDTPYLISGGSLLFALAMGLWAFQVSRQSGNITVNWSQKLAFMEAKSDRSESVLASHPGLVLVWDDSFEDIEQGWGDPKVLGGPAALASLLAFSTDSTIDRPADTLLNDLGELPLEEDVLPDEILLLKDKVLELRAHGVAFSGSVVTKEGRSIEVDGRVAGDITTLWLTDPLVRMAEDGSILGRARDRAADLHGALNQIDRLPMAVWRRGADLKLEWVNKAYVEMVEATGADEVIETQIEIDPAFREFAKKSREAFTKTRKPIAEHKTAANIRGQRRVIKILEMPLHSSGESAIGGVAIDVTRLEDAHEQLDRHQRAHRQILDHMPTAVAVFNAKQNLDYYNSAFTDLWKLDEAELLKQPSHEEILDKLHHHGRLPEQKDFKQWKEIQVSPYTEYAFDAEAPDEIWNMPTGRTLRVVKQRHAEGGVLILFEDITEALNLETKFNTHIKAQAATINNLAEGVAVFASNGDLRLFNSAFQNMWDFDASYLSSVPKFDQITDHFITGFAAPELKQDHIAHWDRLQKRVLAFSAKDRAAISGLEIKLSNGRHISCATAPLPDGATLLTFLDVTDSRERTQQLEERNELLEATDKLKTRFVNHISYTLRNPLNTITGFAEMLETEMFGDLNERQKEYAGNIVTASNHLTNVIDDMIDLAAIDAGKMDLDLTEINIRDTFASVSNFASLKAEDSQINLTIDCADDVDVMMADEKRLRQVLFNLLSNAFAYTDEMGDVTMGARREKDTICLWVQDSGRGVSEENQKRAFERFESAGSGAGAGLGLALVKSFVELHGGWVQMNSRMDVGTTVSCYIPIGMTSDQQTPATSKSDDHINEFMEFAAQNHVAEKRQAEQDLLDLVNGKSKTDNTANAKS